MKKWKAKTLTKNYNEVWDKVIEREFNKLEKEGWTLEFFRENEFNYCLVVCSQEIQKSMERRN